MMAAFSAASWFPQNKYPFLPTASGLIAFSARLSKLLDNLAYPNFNIIQTFRTSNFKTVA